MKDTRVPAKLSAQSLLEVHCAGQFNLSRIGKHEFYLCEMEELAVGPMMRGAAINALIGVHTCPMQRCCAPNRIIFALYK